MLCRILVATIWLVGLSSTTSTERPPRPAAASSNAPASGGEADGAGTSNQNVEPSPSPLLNPTSPPIMSASARVIARPRPDPPNRRAVEPSACVKRWNSEACAAAGMPTPVSCTSKRTRRAPSGPSCTVRPTSTPPSWVNFTALPIRLNRAWRMRTGSARIQGSSAWTDACSCKPFRSASGRSIRTTLSTVSPMSIGSGESSRRPASILEKSMTSLSSCASIWPQATAWSSSPRPSSERASRSSRCSTPSTPFIGVRISWLMLARNCDFASVAASAACWASISSSSCSLRSSMLRTRPTTLSS